MSNKEFYELTIECVVNYYNTKFAKEKEKITKDDVYVVWLCKTLQNHKALLSTNVSDGMYYELTYNGDKRELYLDAYKKYENICFELSDNE